MSITARLNPAIACALLLVVGVININTVSGDDNGDFSVGVGIGDITGPSVGIGMMGYANPDQTAHGIHTRLFARAFIFGSGEQRVVYVSCDLGMLDQAIKTQVVKSLKDRFGPELYTSKNVLLSGTHTHSGPAGYIQYLLYGITSLGFNHQNFEAIVTGIMDSIEQAHSSLQPGKVYISKGEVIGANINRSPSSYLANPLQERLQYKYNVDKDMVLIRINDGGGVPLGAANWFAVHPTSMNNTNRLVSGDNKGYAEMLFESKMNPKGTRPGKGKFIAAFGSTNLGDVSPNTRGPKCINNGEPCDLVSSTCGGFVANCIAFGPGNNMEESTRIIGENQFKTAWSLFNEMDDSMELKGPVQFTHQFVDITDYEISLTDASTGQNVTKRTCKPALGYSFAAGTTDGPGAFDFRQGETSGNAFWDFIRDFLKRPTYELMECQAPKPILLAVGETMWPYEWVPSIIETQILRVGNLFILGVPGELTTMAGRRLRKVVQLAIEAQNPEMDVHVVIAGLSNVYTHYTTTFEEYQEQRYEAASTVYGPYTLDAYMQHYPRLIDALLKGTSIPDGPTPPNLLDRQINLVPPIVVDTTPFLYDFGDVWQQPPQTVMIGETLKTVFISGHPQNNPMRGGSFFLIERQDALTKEWVVERTDADWDTKFEWALLKPLSTLNTVTITWNTTPTELNSSVTPGTYRIRHFGYYKPVLQEPRPYQGSTKHFEVKSIV